jgi:uncharacterized membrane protein
MAQTNDMAKRMMPRGFKVLLGVSLAMNLAVLGVLAGAVLRKDDAGPRRSSGQAHYARPYILALPREERRTIFEASRAAKKGSDHAAHTVMYQEVMDILRSEVFDRSAIEVILSKQAEVTLAAQNNIQVQWLNRIEEMGLQERRDYADTFEEILKRGPMHKRKPKPN